MSSIVVLPNSEGLEPHAVLGLLNDFAEQLGCARVPYLRNGASPAVDLSALKELMDLALGLLDEEAEEDKTPSLQFNSDPYSKGVDPNSYTYVGGGASAGGVYGNLYTTATKPTTTVKFSVANNPSSSKAQVGPGNTKLFHKIAKYAGWSDDLLKGVNYGGITREKALGAIAEFIDREGYNPAIFQFHIQVRPSALVAVVSEAVTGKTCSVVL